MATVHYEGINRSVENEDLDSTLLDISMANKIPHLHECGGNGRCTTCRVRVIEGARNLTKRTLIEKQTAAFRNWDPSVRLACQAYAKGDVRLQRLVWTSAEINKLQLETVPQGTAEERSIAFLFCDLRNFTSLASKNLAFDVAHLLNRFYTALGDPILMNNGVIYQYVGDEIVGLFGTSGGTREKNCTDAVRAALGMLYAANRLSNMDGADFGTKLNIGIGINYGRAFIGHLGHPTHRQFAVVGDPVNVASRIQSLTKEVDCSILASEAVIKSIPEGTLSLSDPIQKMVKGIDTPLSVYHVKQFTSTDLHLELQSSLDAVLQNEEEFAQTFYNRLFEVAPSVRKLFTNDIKMQGRLLTHMLVGIVYALSRPEHLVMGLRSLGKSHEKYGVTAEHYPVVKQVMLYTLGQQLKDDFTTQMEESWSQALDLITGAMKDWKSL